MTLFEYFEKHPEQSVTFTNAMTDLSSGDVAAVLASYEFSPFQHIVDVGGGTGLLLAAILGSASNARGTLFDLPRVIEQAQKSASLSNFGSRCEFAPGSFFDGVPTDADAYILKHVIHDWDDKHAVQILSNCARAMRLDGKVLVVDRVIGPPTSQIKRSSLISRCWFRRGAGNVTRPSGAISS